MRRRWPTWSLSREAPSMVLQSGLNTGAGAETAPALSFEGVGFRYAEADPPALEGQDLEVNAGEILAVAGGNGSGKSTLARLANGLLVPGEGQVCVQGLSTADPSLRFDIPSRVGLLFQNPEDQIVGASVEDDVAFGLENLSVPREEMRIRVAEVLGVVGLEGEERTEPHLLSGGQMQRLALASVLVMRPALLVLDEPTSMLDSRGRQDILGFLRHMGAVLITQRMEEVLEADSLLVLQEGRPVFRGRPREFFLGDGLEKVGSLLPPPPLAVAEELREILGSDLVRWDSPPLTEGELETVVRRVVEGVG